MRKVRRGVTQDQMADDVNRIMNVQDTKSSAPEMAELKDAVFLMADDDSGEVYFRLGGNFIIFCVDVVQKVI